MGHQYFFCLLLLTAWCQFGSARNSREILKQFDGPFLETYWESYMSYPYTIETCYDGIADFEYDFKMITL